jgi:uncharacterized protein YjiS (DUF1127 family)
MSDWHIGNPHTHFIERAQQERADALARAGHLLVAAIGRPLLQAADAIRHWRERRRALRSLMLLDDRMLRDIGLNRGDVWAAVHGRLTDRGIESAPAPAADVALTAHVIGGCNDNQRPRRAA